MHGIIHYGLRRYVQDRHGSAAWQAIVQEAGLTGGIYFVIDTYSDEEAVLIINTASKLTDIPVDTIHEDFGRFMTPDLLRLEHSLIRPDWTMMDLLMYTEETIHRHVRRTVEGAQPPELSFEKTGPNSLDLYYNSERNMPGVARGILRGIADHYDERISIEEKRDNSGATIMHIILGSRRSA